jgi:general secretion pathway protein G
MAHPPPKRCFTLLELLVVVGILSILSAISLSNYIDAQTRAKVARVMSDMRILAAAIEQYRVDHNLNPRMAHFRFYEDPEFDVILGESVNGVMSRALSTPVAYISNTLIVDPFMHRMGGAQVDERLYTYQDLEAYALRNHESRFWPVARSLLGPWRLGSVGPDLTFDHGFSNSAQLPYDPTNGTISFGNIWHVQRGGFDTTSSMHPDLLGEHS